MFGKKKESNRDSKTPQSIRDLVLKRGLITQQDYSDMAQLAEHPDRRSCMREIADAIEDGTVLESMYGSRRTV